MPETIPVDLEHLLKVMTLIDNYNPGEEMGIRINREASANGIAPIDLFRIFWALIGYNRYEPLENDAEYIQRFIYSRYATKEAKSMAILPLITGKCTGKGTYSDLEVVRRISMCSAFVQATIASEHYTMEWIGTLIQQNQEARSSWKAQSAPDSRDRVAAGSSFGRYPGPAPQPQKMPCAAAAGQPNLSFGATDQRMAPTRVDAGLSFGISPGPAPQPQQTPYYQPNLSFGATDQPNRHMQNANFRPDSAYDRAYNGSVSHPAYAHVKQEMAPYRDEPRMGVLNGIRYDSVDLTLDPVCLPTISLHDELQLQQSIHSSIINEKDRLHTHEKVELQTRLESALLQIESLKGKVTECDASLKGTQSSIERAYLTVFTMVISVLLFLFHVSLYLFVSAIPHVISRMNTIAIHFYYYFNSCHRTMVRNAIQGQREVDEVERFFILRWERRKEVLGMFMLNEAGVPQPRIALKDD